MEIKYDKLPEHMRGGARRYIEHGIMPGHFMRAVLANEFIMAFMLADAINAAAMRDWADWIYNEVPFGCHGSRARVAEWVKSGGMNGPTGGPVDTCDEFGDVTGRKKEDIRNAIVRNLKR